MIRHVLISLLLAVGLPAAGDAELQPLLVQLPALP